ncbi:hypothetical protein CU044_2994 [Streptomyces sp. L-9-10]|nr:hypothetical protein CU044_2994 [Streptomyces sp. L-9-10]
MSYQAIRGAIPEEAVHFRETLPTPMKRGQNEGVTTAG